MKKINLCVLMCCTVLTQLLQAQHIRLGVTAGATFGRLITKIDNSTDRSDLNPGYSLGLVSDIVLSEKIMFQPGLHFLQKGGREKNDISGITTQYAITINDFELPLNFIYRSNGEKGHFIGGLGPSLSYGLFGKTKLTYNGQTSSEKIHFGSNQNDDLKPFELSGNLLAGYEFKTGMWVVLNYNAGFSNIATDPDVKGRTNYFGLRIGYFLYNWK